MKNLFRTQTIVFTLIILIPLIPAAILSLHDGNFHLFDLVVIVAALIGSFVTLRMLVVFITAAINAALPKQPPTPKVNQPYQDPRRWHQK